MNQNLPRNMDPRTDFDVDEHKILLPHIICVEGNIGSGKSTLLNNLENEGFRIIPEPVKHIWGQYLPRLYDNLERWGCSFQMEVIDWFRQLQATQLHQEIKQTCNQRMIHKKNKQLQNDQNKVNNIGNNSNNNSSNNSGNDNVKVDDCKQPSSNESTPDGYDSDSNNNCNTIDRDISMFELTDNISSINNNSVDCIENIENIENIDPNDNISDSCNGKQNESNNNIKNDKTDKNSKNSKNNKNVFNSEFIIVERSALSAFNIFSTNLYESGLLTEWEYSLLKRWYALVMWQPKYILYLRCNPQTSIKRIHQRNRNGENKVDPNLIKILHSRHETMFVQNYGKNSDNFEINENDYKPTKYPYSNNNNNLCKTKKPSIIYVNGNNDEKTVLFEALTKIGKLPMPEPMMCNICKDCGTPRVQPRMLSFKNKSHSKTPKNNTQNKDCKMMTKLDLHQTFLKDMTNSNNY